MQTLKKQSNIGKNISRRKVMPTLDYKDWLAEQLKDIDFAAGYITESIEEGEAAFLLAVRDVVDVHGGLGKLSKMTSLNREGLYNTLSKNGNPTLSSLKSIFDALGLQIAVKAKSDENKAA